LVETFLDSIFQESIVTITLGAGVSIVAYFKSIRNKQIENKDAIDKLCIRAWRIEKAIALMAMVITQQTKTDHPATDTADLEKLTKEIMTDEL